jgi:hypothetical protein
MGWECGTYGVRERCAKGVGEETKGKETTEENEGVGGGIILRRIFRNSEGVVCTGWIWLRIEAVGGRVCTVKNFPVP